MVQSYPDIILILKTHEVTRCEQGLSVNVRPVLGRLQLQSLVMVKTHLLLVCKNVYVIHDGSRRVLKVQNCSHFLEKLKVGFKKGGW